MDTVQCKQTIKHTMIGNRNTLLEWRSLLILWVLLRSNCGAFSLKRPSSFLGKSALSSGTTTTTDPNLDLLSARGRAALDHLKSYDKDLREQTHVYENWPPPGTSDEEKIALCEQLADLDDSYPGGLPNYLSKAKKLLEESASGSNPFADFKAKVPEGTSVTFDTNLQELEQAGLELAGDAVFVLVAGGLGERLGYSGIKLSLETNVCDNVCYLEYYIQYLTALEGRTNNSNIPLVIMTSGDTDAPTRALLQEHDNFGKSNIHIVTQDKVAALKDNTAGLAMDGLSIQTKPHGHGDVHHLLLKSGLIDQFQKENKKYVVFLQDTNALVVNSILPTLAVSASNQFVMNSICIPRLAGEAAGAIARLEHKKDPKKSLVINVEYNQLDPLLRTQGEGDVPDPETGYSPFPGNANNLVFELSGYAKTLRGEDQGVVLEFVNPKYKDDTRTEFKKPTRLECMMQDIPKLFQKELESCNIGFTMFDRWFTFSPAKNALEAGQESVQSGSNAPGTLSSAESDFYIQYQRKLAAAGAKFETSELKPVAGIPVTMGPRVVLAPSFAMTQKELNDKISGSVSLTETSALILDGQYLSIDGLELDGALVIRAGPESHVKVDNLKVQNAGWDLQELDPSTKYPESVSIRGYTMNKKETTEIVIAEPGNFVVTGDGEVKRVD